MKRCNIEESELLNLLDRALSLLTDEEVIQIFAYMDMEIVPADIEQLERLNKLVEGVEL